MALEEKQSTVEQTIAMNKQMEESQAKVDDLIRAGDVFKSLDLPPAEEKQEKTEEEQPQEKEERAEEQASESEEQPKETESAEAQGEDEELVPKSKVQKRIDALTARIKQLESEVSKPVETAKDDLTAKLEAMSEPELRQAKREARLAQIQNAGDADKLSQLLDLEDKIDTTLRTAPERFSQQQVKNFQLAAERLGIKAMEDGVEITPNVANDIKKIAAELYQETPELQKSVMGQAQALNLAYRHYREISRLGSNKGAKSEEVQRLKSQVNTLKKKTSLDTKVIKGNMDSTRLADLQHKAMTGNTRDKNRFIRDDPRFNIDAMIPPEYKE